MTNLDLEWVSFEIPENAPEKTLTNGIFHGIDIYETLMAEKNKPGLIYTEIQKLNELILFQIYPLDMISSVWNNIIGVTFYRGTMGRGNNRLGKMKTIMTMSNLHSAPLKIPVTIKYWSVFNCPITSCMLGLLPRINETMAFYEMLDASMEGYGKRFMFGINALVHFFAENGIIMDFFPIIVHDYFWLHVLG